MVLDANESARRVMDDLGETVPPPNCHAVAVPVRQDALEALALRSSMVSGVPLRVGKSKVP